jgi:hypothetical protein
VRRRLQLPPAAPGLRGRRRRPSAIGWGRPVVITSPVSERTCRTISRSTCSTPRRSRCRSAVDGDVARPLVGLMWLFRKGPGATNHFEGAGSSAATTTWLPQPHVPLPAHRHPLRRHPFPTGARLPGPHRPDVLRRPGVGEDQEFRPAREPGHASSTTCPPTRTVASGWSRSGSRGTSSASRHWTRSTPARSHPGPVVETDEEILDWVSKRRRDGAAPVVHLPDGHRRHVGGRPHLTMRVHGTRRGAGGRCLGDALRHQRQHLRPGDDAGREGRRSHPG